MNITVVNPKEDMYGNVKENIFLAFDNNGEFSGSAYVYPRVNHHQARETPYLLFIEVNTDYKEVRQELFSKVVHRAKALRKLRPDLNARIYTGFEPDEERLAFYIENGFHCQYSVVMRAVIPKGFSYDLPENLRALEIRLDNEDKFNKYKAMYDEIFITPLDTELYREQEKNDLFKNIAFYKDEQCVGGCTLFKDQGSGHIETLFVTEEHRGKGFGKNILMFAFNYFKSNGLDKSKLEVWELNSAAVEFYKGLGYKR